MNPVLMITYNNLELTKKAVESVLNQTIPVHLILIDNGSTDGTKEWAIEALKPLENVEFYASSGNYPVVMVANRYLKDIFSTSPYVLCIPNDVILHPTLYEEFLKWPRGVVTGSEIRDRKTYDAYIKDGIPETQAVSQNTPMAVIMWRKWVYDAVIARDGYFFDERFVHYASDCDMALRVSSCGIRGIQLNTPFWHYGSASVRLADPFHLERIRFDADADRAKFVQKWGFAVGDCQYSEKAVDINFRGEHAS